MEKMKDLKDLLTHEVEDLLSAEKQIIEALPSMIEKAKNQQLKNALQEHLQVTERQKTRIEEIVEILKKGHEQDEKTGLLSRLFSGGEKTCKGMQGLIKEGEKIMAADMNPQVLDAAIIACAQKIEHYEICGYGTVKAYADELNLPEISARLEKTLNEEYKADDLLTSLAIGGLNQKAENGRSSRNSRPNKTSATHTDSSNGKRKPAKKTNGSPRNSTTTSKNKNSAKSRQSRASTSKKRTAKSSR